MGRKIQVKCLAHNQYLVCVIVVIFNDVVIGIIIYVTVWDSFPHNLENQKILEKGLKVYTQTLTIIF